MARKYFQRASGIPNGVFRAFARPPRSIFRNWCLGEVAGKYSNDNKQTKNLAQARNYLPRILTIPKNSFRALAKKLAY